MKSSAWEMSYLGHGGGGHGGGHEHGDGIWFEGGPGFYEEGFMLPLVSACPPGTALDPSGSICNPVAPLKGLGQFNPLATVAGAMGVNTSGMQKDVANLEKNVEMYAYAQLGLQTVAAAATFGFFLITLYTFLRKRRKGEV
jgi:hypothetical protein